MNYKYLKSFMSDIYKKIHENSIQKRNDDEIDSINIDNGVALPAKYNKSRIFGLGGVVNNNKIVEQSFTYTCANFISPPHPLHKTIDFGGYYSFDNNKIIHSNTQVIYLGNIINHWGHFLIQFTSRLWIYEFNNEKLRYIYLVKEGEDFKPIGQIIEFLSFLNIYENIDFINQPTSFQRIIIPKPSYIPNYYFSDKYKKIFSKVVNEALIDHNYKDIEKNDIDKIYFTRLNFKAAKEKEFGEDYFKNIFKKNGFSIFSPELLSLKEQIYLIHNAKIICCINGTLAHNMLFGDVKTVWFILNKISIINLMQRDIIEIMKFNALYVDCYYQYYPCSMGFGPFLLAKTEEFVTFCIDNEIAIDTINNYDYFEMSEYISKIKPVKGDFITDQKASCFFNPLHSLEFIHNFLPLINKKIYFRYHFSMIGWIDNIKNSEFVITKYQLEAIQVVCNIRGLVIVYSVLQNDEWQNATTENTSPAGITGKTLPIRGIKIKCVSGNDSYGVVYRICTKDNHSSFYTDKDICCIAEPDIICGLQIILYKKYCF